MLKFFNSLFLALVLFMISFVAFSQEVAATIPAQLPVNDLINAFMNLVTNWKVLGVWGLCAAIINIVVMILKADFTDKWFLWSTKGHLVKMLILVVLGQIEGIVISIQTGMIWWQAAISGLFISGGAIIIYNTAKPIFTKVDVAINSAAAKEQKAIETIKMA